MNNTELNNQSNIPTILAGPILRKTTHHQLVYWLVTSCPASFSIEINQQTNGNTNCATQTYQIGDKAFIHLIQFKTEVALPNIVELDILLKTSNTDNSVSLCELMPHLLYSAQQKLRVEITNNIEHMYHGSCRKPHHNSPDALVTLDQEIHNSYQENNPQHPALLMMSGDQVYVDDVAVPFLQAIEQTIQLLGLYQEQLPKESDLTIEDIQQSPFNYYQRAKLLPSIRPKKRLWHSLFSLKNQPIFTSNSADQHLITLAEMLAMYLLTWSKQLWPCLTITDKHIPLEFINKYQQEQQAITAFSQQLDKVERLLAHIPTYMIFDDHDVTDDWNLTRGWEEAAYHHPFSKRIIGNALIGYFLAQGWGNEPDNFNQAFHQHVQQCFDELKSNNTTATAHNKLIEVVLNWEQWHYQINTEPYVVVLDTRTHRWRSESNSNKPSGLMGWETLTELQQTIIGKQSVILVSPAPIFGVKFIEVVQRIFTFFGKALAVDAENWMAHPGSANVMLNIFLHKKTPQHFIILSGDVHYSFAFDVNIRRKQQSPDIYQITASGLKNSFPKKLLNIMNTIDRLLYGSLSPLNIFTKRRRMRIKSRRVNGQRGHRIINQSAIGKLTLNEHGQPKEIALLTSNNQIYKFNSKT